ncbi:MAG: trehalose-phosphatase, partial [Gemmatimonadales bacterium]
MSSHNKTLVSPVPPAPRRDWAYFFDIDGTLADIAATPARARVSDTVRRRIAALHEATGGAVALISGRAIADIDRLFPGVRMPAAGQH